MLSLVNARDLPLGLKNQTAEEAEYLSFHICIGGGEAYGASYLITKEHLLLQFTDLPLNWVNCELASFMMMTPKRSLKPNHNGQIIQSLDVLDFSAIHLSAYERLTRRNHYKKFYKKTPADTIEKMALSTASLKKRIANDVNIEKTPELQRTLAVMPFFGTGMGSGHSVLANRYKYLETCFWSIYSEIPHIVVGVTSQVDYDYCKNESGLPFFDVILNKDLPRGSSNPVSTVQQVKKRFQSGEYDFDYMFFTESDQVLLMRKSAEMFQILKNHPRYIIIPHRLMPYPETIVKKKLHKNWANDGQDVDHSWYNMSCCLPRQNCKNRKGWTSVKSESVPIVSAYGLLTPLGNTNFLDEVYRFCTMMESRVDVCP
eukprot:CAMPEP_0114422952 /NCGR_PEP_ID=MMETSP0103-20121206/5885_1 /TAXON_ID=37642 ORGANISM="Paraphysomonas imperforata, Strain PA2" /NCGR_SAMPLE_ID=MMETSP0103 /ASSEMBLY_ACC=CAM_ASM_000201 /LENGTH=371 /DNA_ID=CAMNT_0001591573 /DNA_START=88 /DNA_END=1203 /DNA_ORIENTATION=+